MKNKFFSNIIFNGVLYCISMEKHILMKINIETGKVDYIDIPDGYILEKGCAADRMICDQGRIYFFELNGRRMMQYDISVNKCKYYDIGCQAYHCLNFAGVGLYEEKIYIFPSFFDMIVIVDLKSNEVKKQMDLCPDIIYKYEEHHSIPFRLFSCTCQIDNSMWIFMESHNRVIEYNMKNGCFRYHKLPSPIKGCAHVEWRNKLFYILSIDGRVYTWDFSNGEMEEIVKDKAIKEPYFPVMIVTEKTVWILPDSGDDIWIIDQSTHKMEKYVDYPVDFCYEACDGRSKYARYCEDENHYYLSMPSGNYFLTIEKKSGKGRWINPIQPSPSETLEYYIKNRMLYESKYTLKEYMKSIKKQVQLLDDITYNVGNLIWNQMRIGRQ